MSDFSRSIRSTKIYIAQPGKIEQGGFWLSVTDMQS